MPGRVIQTAIGKDGFSKSLKMTVGFARYSAESGPMLEWHVFEYAEGGYVDIALSTDRQSGFDRRRWLMTKPPSSLQA